MDDWETADDAVYDLAKRASELCDQPIDNIRLALSSDIEGRLGPARTEFLGDSKGELIERLLIEEFCNEDDLRILTEEGEE